MHSVLIALAALICLSAFIVVVCHINDEDMTPVAKTFSSLFIGCCALVLTIQVFIDHPGQTALASVQGYAPSSVPPAESQSLATVAAPVTEPRTVVAAPAGQVVTQVAAPSAVVQAVAQPERDSSVKDMLLGGALGYALGSGGRGGETHTVTNNTTVVHSAPFAPSAPAATYRPAAPAPAPRPTVAAAPRQTFKSTFSMTRSGRR